MEARHAVRAGLMSTTGRKDFLRLLLVTALTLVSACDSGRKRINVLTAHGEAEVTLMDFSTPFPLDPPPAGWYHRTFWTRAPMQMAFAAKDGVPALRLETRSSASMLFRHVDFDLTEYRYLIWRWYIERPIESALDERTRAGDDAPCALVPGFPDLNRGGTADGDHLGQ